ncbi:hypothetical protein P43SY_004851 [Pythium insidiosum]|uniref:Uncharacterized protein n=1 Tax=Pythium insidiosum TaxID=114742 RepID=A0AAD5Q5N6_PYTIN|nr:hypothetical protein P43SY_004851 [Pythium insidiosum]
MEHLQASYYSQNHENVFTQTEHNFMKKVPPTLHVTFLEPYRSLNWSRRELLRDVAKSKAERSHDEGEEETTWYLITQLSQYAPSDFESDQSELEGDDTELWDALPAAELSGIISKADVAFICN